MDVNQIILGALPAVAVRLCLICCGSMVWMMSRGEQKKRRGEQNDKRHPPSA